MRASQAARLGLPSWSRVRTGSPYMAAADRDALGTTARIVVWPPENLNRLLAVVDDELAALDRQASRFRPDSEISLVNASGAGSHVISDGLAEAIGIALAAASWTEGRCDPTLGDALISLGYDRDFAAMIREAGRERSAASGPEASPAPRPEATPGRGREPGPASRPPADAASRPAEGAASGPRAAVRASRPAALGRRPGWPRSPGQRTARLRGNVLELSPGVRLDLGATAKGLGADRAARAAYAAAGTGGVLVSLGGDLAVVGKPPRGGWPVLVADEHRQTRAARNLAARPGVRSYATSASGWPGQPAAEADPATAQQIRLGSGGLATSSVTCRQWRRDGHLLHHIIDPVTSMPALGPWRTVSVAAVSCAEANAAATAAIVAGPDAPAWLTAQGLPARLVGHDGSITLTGGWPATDGGQIHSPTSSRLQAADRSASSRTDRPPAAANLK